MSSKTHFGFQAYEARVKREFYEALASSAAPISENVARFAELQRAYFNAKAAYHTARVEAQARARALPAYKEAVARETHSDGSEDVIFEDDPEYETCSENIFKLAYHADADYKAAVQAFKACESACVEFRATPAYEDVRDALTRIPKEPSTPLPRIKYRASEYEWLLVFSEGDGCHCANCPGTLFSKSCLESGRGYSRRCLVCAFCGYTYHEH